MYRLSCFSQVTTWMIADHSINVQEIMNFPSFRQRPSALKRSEEHRKILFEGALAFTWHNWTPMLVGTSFLRSLWNSYKLKACQPYCSSNPIAFKSRTWLHNFSGYFAKKLNLIEKNIIDMYYNRGTVY